MTLGDFGGGLEQPRIKKKGRVHTTTPDGTKVVGHWGPSNRGRAFVTARDSHDHRLRALDAYAFSDDALDTLRDTEVKVVFVLERDTDDVYEWRLAKFDQPVPEKFLETVHDPQCYATRQQADAKWPGLGLDLLEPPETPDDVLTGEVDDGE